MSVNRVKDFSNGEQLLSSDLAQAFEAALDKAGAALSYALGIDSMQSAEDPLQFSVDGSSNVTIGGPNQRCILAGRQCDEINAQTFSYGSTLPANATGSPRVDVIYSAPAEPTTGAVLDNIEIGIGSFDTAMIGYKQQGVAFEYVPQGGTPTAGYVPVLQVTVPASSGTIVAADLLLLLPTAARALTKALDLPFISVPSYPGFDPTGATDSYPAFAAAFADAQATGINRVLFYGTPAIGTSLVAFSAMTLEGTGGFSGCSIKQLGNATILTSSGSPTFNVTLTGFSFFGRPGATGGRPVDLTNVAGVCFENGGCFEYWNAARLTGCTAIRWFNWNCDNNVADGARFDTCTNAEFTACRFDTNGGNGAVITGSYSALTEVDFTFTGGGSVNNNQNTLGNGIFLDQWVCGVHFNGFDMGRQVPGGTTPQLYGLVLVGDNDFITAQGCPMFGNATAPIHIISPFGPNCVFQGNPGLNPWVNQTSFANPAIPATNVPLQNPFGDDATLNLQLGSSTTLDYQVEIGGVGGTFVSLIGVVSSGRYNVPLRCGQRFKIVYPSGAPTVDWLV